jgi:glutamate racemase
MRNKKIGVFDSGFGGLTVLRGIRKILPEYDYIYLCDTARAPYGTRSRNVIYKFTEQAVGYLFNQGCELIVLACNTASSEALRKIQQEYLPKHYPEKRVLGVVIPTCEKAVDSGYKKIGVMATNSTVESGSYVREIKKLDESADIIQVPCPLLVPIIESGDINQRVLSIVLSDYLDHIKNKTEVIILGCTHYEIIEKQIKDAAGDILVIPQSGFVAEKLKDYLGRHPEIEQKLSRRGSVDYRSTDITEKFKIFAEEILSEEIAVKSINL